MVEVMLTVVVVVQDLVLGMVQGLVLGMVQGLVHMVELEPCTDIGQAITVVVTTRIHDRHQ